MDTRRIGHTMPYWPRRQRDGRNPAPKHQGAAIAAKARDRWSPARHKGERTRRPCSG